MSRFKFAIVVGNDVAGTVALEQGINDTLDAIILRISQIQRLFQHQMKTSNLDGLMTEQTFSHHYHQRHNKWQNYPLGKNTSRI